MRSAPWRSLAVAAAVAISLMPAIGALRRTARRPAAHRAYLGFDANNYPGDAALSALRREFYFAGYWLNEPPGGASISWTGKRARLVHAGFGFLVLFNGRLERELQTPARAEHLGSSDAELAVHTAIREGFHPGTIIFLDQEEGGEMEPDQIAYLLAWIDGIEAAHFRAGIYCSGIAASAGKDGMVISAEDIRRRTQHRAIAFFVYNDACPPSPGCAISGHPPAPSKSGLPFASIWQFAQSPRRRQYTARCSGTYNLDGNCYSVDFGRNGLLIDLYSSTSPDPSNGRR
ncbi:MAG: glycoside hydrolase domain-containing protein [Candidatus Acidiferrales bacterium]